MYHTFFSATNCKPYKLQHNWSVVRHRNYSKRANNNLINPSKGGSVAEIHSQTKRTLMRLINLDEKAEKVFTTLKVKILTEASILDYCVELNTLSGQRKFSHLDCFQTRN